MAFALSALATREAAAPSESGELLPAVPADLAKFAVPAGAGPDLIAASAVSDVLVEFEPKE